jgi:hypothetical protein
MANVQMHCKRHAATFKSKHRKKEPTDINDFADEYLRLAYHGFVQKTNLSMQILQLILMKALEK